MRNKVLQIAILLFIILNTFIVAQRYNINHYSSKEGLSEAQIFSIVQDSLGFMYFATNGAGFDKFDGRQFKNYNIQDGLLSNTIYNLFKDTQNRIWIGTSKGVSVLEKGELKSFNTENGLLSNSVWAIAENRKKEILIATENGVNIFSQNKIDTINIRDIGTNNAVFSVLVDHSDNIWLATRKGLFKIDPYNKVHLMFNEVFKNSVINYLFEDSYNNFWIGTYSGLYRIENGKAVIYHSEIIKKDTYIHHIFEDSKNTLWISSNIGLIKIENEKIELLSEKNGLGDNTARWVYEDYENNLWIGTDNGIDVMVGKQFVLFSENSKLTDSWCIYEDDNGRILIGLEFGGVQELRNGKLFKVKEFSELDKRTVWAIKKDHSGNLWFGIDKGVAKYSNGKIQFFDETNGYTYDETMNIFTDSKGNLWFATFWEGLFKYDGSRFINYTPEQGLNSYTVYSMLELPNGSILIGTEEGMNLIKEDSINFFDPINYYKDFSVMDLQLDKHNNVWAALFGGGVVRFDGENVFDTSSVRIYSDKNGLNDNSSLFLLADDEKNNIWVGTNQGLNIIDFDSTKNAIHAYDKYDAIPGIECNQSSRLKDSKGNLWFGTIAGIIRYTEDSEIDNEKSIPPVLFTEVESFFEPITGNSEIEYSINSYGLEENLILPYNLNHLTFRYTCLSYKYPQKINYRYKLVGQDDKWSPPSKDFHITFSGLAPGNYSLMLEASTKNGMWNNNIAVYNFKIKSPFWKTPLFIISAAFIFLLILRIGYKRRVETIKEKTRSLERYIKTKAKYEAVIKQSEKDYRGVFENAHAPIIVLDIDNLNVLDANLAASKLYENSIIELKQLNLNQICSDIENWKERIELLTDGRNIRNFETFFVQKSGGKVLLDVNATVLKYKEIDSVIIMHRDITERKKVEQYLLSAKQKAEKSDKMKSEFLAQMSHEIRTPINTILNYTSLLHLDLSDTMNEDNLESFKSINSASKRLIRTIDLILNMSEIETDTYEPLFEKIDIINDIIKPLIFEFRSEASKKGINITLIGEKECNLKIDRYTVTQIISNLLDNSIKYTHMGEIELREYRRNGYICLDVKDTGIGISEEFMPDLFKMFSQEEQGYTRKYDGTGLGLAIVKKYCEINNASIEVLSKKGDGTTFTIIFESNLES